MGCLVNLRFRLNSLLLELKEQSVFHSFIFMRLNSSFRLDLHMAVSIATWNHAVSNPFHPRFSSVTTSPQSSSRGTGWELAESLRFQVKEKNYLQTCC